MKIYLDMCALKRPFDDQSQGRIALESYAVVRILKASYRGVLSLCNSSALAAENVLNPDATRRQRADVLLRTFGRRRKADAAVFSRAMDLRAAGIGDMDALHMAFAERQAAEYFLTCDDNLLKKGPKLSLKSTVIDPVTFVEKLNI